jgi:hypothetical protein
MKNIRVKLKLLLIIIVACFALNEANAQCNIAISGRNSICQDDTLLLIAHGASSYTWMPGAIHSDTLKDTPTSPLVYTITAATGSCSATTTIAVNVNPKPDSDFVITPGIPCMPAWYSFEAPQISNATCAWTFGDGSTGNGFYVGHAYYGSGQYAINMTITSDSGCIVTSTQYEYVTLHPNPIASFNASPQFASISNPTINFSNQSVYADTYQWHFGDSANSTSTIISPSFTYSDTGHFLVQLIAANMYGCADTVVEYIVISADNGISTFSHEEAILSPNPCRDYILVEVANEIEELRITDHIGKEVTRQKNKAVNQKIDLAGLDSGVYFLSITTKNGFITRKIVKE